MIGRHHIGLLGASLLALGVLEVNGRRGPGRQLRDERERVGEPLRVLAAYAANRTPAIVAALVAEMSDAERERFYDISKSALRLGEVTEDQARELALFEVVRLRSA